MTAKRASEPLPAPTQERADALREENAVIATPNAYATVAPPTARFAPSPPPTVDTATRNVAAAAPAAPSPATAGAAAGSVMNLQAAAPQRAKQEAAADSFTAKELKKSAALPERDVELERIAKLREGGKNTEADKALEEFRKRYPDFRIPEAMWERVRPR